MPPSETQLIDNYDVSYVDTLGLPASMEATLVPSTPPTATGSGQYAWVGADQSTTDMQQSVANFTTNNTSVSTDPNGVNGLGTYFNGLGWDQFYLPSDNTTTAGGMIAQINNNLDGMGKQTVPVTIITKAGGTAGLVDGAAVTITGVTGQTAINGTWVISNVFPAGNSFALVGIAGNGVSSSGGTFAAVQTTGIDVQKLAAGSDATALSPNVNSPSQFDSTKFNLVSGGTIYNIDTTSTGLATKGQTTITGVLATQARQMLAGMLWNPAFNAASQQLFPTGTTVSSIAPDGLGMGTYTITMSAAATATGSPGFVGCGRELCIRWFSIHLGDHARRQSHVDARKHPREQQSDDHRPERGDVPAPGMMVTGSQIPAGTYIAATPGSISADFKTITLTQSIGATASVGALHLRWSARFLCSPDADQQLVCLGRLLRHPVGFRS